MVICVYYVYIYMYIISTFRSNNSVTGGVVIKVVKITKT